MSKYVIEKGLPIPERGAGGGPTKSALSVALVQMEPGDSLDFSPKTRQQVNSLL